MGLDWGPDWAGAYGSGQPKLIKPGDQRGKQGTP
jgi:hypothetical protein